MIKQNLIMFVSIVTVVSAIVVQQSFAQANIPKANIVNSKYLTIKDQKFRSADNSITGTIVNNSTSQITLAEVYAILYNKGDHLITVVSGIADVSNLKPGDDSAFRIGLYSLSSADTIDHYTLMPGGTPA